jgi:4-amino-4-deoxy-L-arabinose transferase-like glycosyltransferase
MIAALYLVTLLHGLGAADIVGDDEAREVGIVQEIVAGNGLWPAFNGETIPDKPTLWHWLAAVPCAVAGFSETAVRLLSALAGAALVAWTAAFGRTLLGGRAGVAAAALLATMPSLFNHARVARPDVLMVWLLAIALGRAFRWWRDAQRRDAVLALVWLGLAVAAKGPVAPALFAVAIGGFLLWQRQLRRLPGLVTFPGVTALLALGGGWYALALWGWGDRFVTEHLIGRYGRNLAGGLVRGGSYSPKPWTYHVAFYLRMLPAIALPWTPLVLVTLWQRWRTAPGFVDPRFRFLVCWALAPAIVFLPAEWKLRYYLLPSLPAMALLAAPAALALLEHPGRPTGRLPLARAAMAIAAGIVAVIVAWAILVRPELLSASDRANLDALTGAVPGGAPGFAALAGVLVGVLAGAVALEAWGLLVALAFTATATWLVVGAPAMERVTSRRDSLAPFAAAVAAARPVPAPLVFVDPPMRSVIVYLGRHVPTVAPDALPQGSSVIADEARYAALAGSGRLGPPLAVGAGRIGNLKRSRVVLADVLPTP